MRARKYLLIVMVFSCTCVGLMISRRMLSARAVIPIKGRGWQTVFTETFSTPPSTWTITSTEDGYEWGIVTYTNEVNTMLTMLLDGQGLWAAGGGALGRVHSWPTGTYTNSMVTWARSEPFPLPSRVWEMRLRLRVQNRVAPGDTFFVGLSGDGRDFTGITVTDRLEDWQEITWSTQAYTNAESVWIGLRFQSDEVDVDAGVLVDDLSLELNYGYAVYLPVTLRESEQQLLLPPNTLSTYVDHFDDSTSGWYTGPALRYNNWCRWETDCHEGWEVVAKMAYAGGDYRFFIPHTWHGGGGDVDTWFVWPVETAPLPEFYYPLPDRYCIEARGRFISDAEYQPWWAHWGIVFGATDDLNDVYTFQVNANHDVAALRYYNYIYPGNRQPPGGEEINVEIPINDWAYGDLSYIPTREYNTLKVAVRGRGVAFYVNDILTSVNYVGDIPRDHIGLIGGSWEVTPVDIRVDYFKYDPHCPEAQ